MKYPKLREIIEALKALIYGPITTKFPKKPHIPFPGFRGKPVPDENKCIACGACAIVCPSNAIEVRDNLNKVIPTREIIWHYDICIFCGQCERLCTTKNGVKLSSNEFDLSTFNRRDLISEVEKELIICEKCKSIISTKEHIIWLYKRLGELCSGNFTVILTVQNQLGLSETTNIQPLNEGWQRSDLFRILCPKCQHLVQAFNHTGKQP